MNHTKRVIGLRSRTRAIFHYRHLTHRTGTAAPLSENMSRKSLYADLVAKRLKAAADNLPPLSEIAIYSHHGYDSEHPYKILVGHTPRGRVNVRQKVWVRLGRTSVRANQAPDMIYHTCHHNPATLPFHSLEDVDLVEPFRTLWENTRPRITNNMDDRKGWIKGLCYWYWAADAERRGLQLRLPKSIPNYLMAAVKRVGVMKHGTTKNMVMEKSGTEEVGEVLGRLERLEVEQREVEMRMVEDEKRRERMKTLEEELGRFKEVDEKDTGDGQVVSGKSSGVRGMADGHAEGDEPRKRHVQQGNKRRRTVVEDTGSDNSEDSDFDPLPAIASPISTQSRNKRRKTNVALEVTTPKLIPAPSTEQHRQRASRFPRLLFIATPPVTPPTLSADQLISSLKLTISDAEQLTADIADIEGEERDLNERMERLKIRKMEAEARVRQNKKEIGKLAERLA
jgi:hypothetical protein